MTTKDHWERIYGRKAPDEVSWYRPHLERSLDFIERAGLAPDAAIIDVGGGASTLVDDLLGRGYTNLTVLDVSAAAIDAAKARLSVRTVRNGAATSRSSESFPGLHLYYPSRREVTPALRAFIETMKSDS